MQIHELNTFSGTPGASDYLATDNGTDTSKISVPDLFAPLNARIDNIIAGPASSAEEVIDARLGADGVTYPSLGDAIRDQISDLSDIVSAEFPRLGSSSFTWTIGKTINSSGNVTTNVATAITDLFTVSGGSVITNESNAVGMNSKSTIFHVNQYKNGVWQSRTAINVNEDIKLADDTDGVRLTFGYAGASGNTETQADVDQNFGVQIVSQVATKAEFDALASDVSKAITTDATKAEIIPSETDYNTLTTEGNYRCNSGSSAQTMINCPVSVAHRLIVFKRNSSTTITQIIITSNATSAIWIRDMSSSWHKIVLDMETITTNGSNITGSNLPADDFNDLPLNSIYSLTTTAVALMANAPKGNLNVAGASDSYGTPSGTVLTFKGATIGGESAVVQIFCGQSGGEFAQPIINIRHKYYSNDAWSWTPWGQLATLYGVMRATNTFIQESRIQAGTADFDDMDNAPNNTIYQIDLDAVSMAHNPISGRSSVLITFAPSFVSDHGRMQLCCGLEQSDAYTPQIYIRYGYQQSSSEYRWTNWMKIVGESSNKYLENKGRLSNGTNLNTITDNSIYLLGSNGGYTPDPLSGNAGFLTTKTVGAVSMQTAERLNGNRYTRYTTDGGSTWTNWV